MLNAHVAEHIVLNAKRNLMNLLLALKFKNGQNLRINKKIMTFGFKNTRENAQLASNLFKNMLAVIM